jgi:(R,R)-butanediol dehydrogenase/meso-butanediol dehydrogenase/diacetyl reductase
LKKLSNSEIALLLHFYGLALITLCRRNCGPRQVRIKVAYCGICGSDLHEYLAGPVLIPQVGEKHPHTGMGIPVTLGHEMSGTIIEVGTSVTEFKVGQNCTVNPSVDDRHHGMDPCRSCLEGKPNLCKRWACYGLSAEGGGLSDEIVVHSASIVPIPDGVSLKVAALTEPLAVAAHMVSISGFKANDNVLVLGAGPIGLAILLLLKAQNARKVFVSEMSESKAAMARQFHADMVIDPSKGNSEVAGGDVVVDCIQKQTEDGVDVAFDTVGIQATLDTAIAATRPGGTIFNVAIHEKALLLNPNLLTLTEKKYTGGLCYTAEDFRYVLDTLASGKIAAEALITAVVPLTQAVEGAFEELVRNRDNHIKILVQPGK